MNAPLLPRGIEHWPLARLKPYARNSKTHDADQVAKIAASMTAFSDPGDLIYEPFCGSGTQIVAAERAGRRCLSMELDPVYCDVAVRRGEKWRDALLLDQIDWQAQF